MGKIAISRRFEWDSAHRIAGHEGACKAIHGHRYVAEVCVTAGQMDSLGRVIDFGVLKSELGAWIDANLDHTAMFDANDADEGVQAVIAMNRRMGRPVYLMRGPPTVEVLAAELGRVFGPLLAPFAIELVSIKLWETPNCWALWTAE